MNYILGIDTHSALGLSFVADSKGDVLSHKYVDAKLSHAEQLFLAIKDVLNQASIDLSKIATVLYVAGPGSFTGLRIAYSAASGFKSANNSVLTKGVSSLKALINNVKDLNLKSFALIKAGKNDLYAYSIDENGLQLIPESLFSLDDILAKLSQTKGNKILVGSAALEYKERFLSIEGVQVPSDSKLHLLSPDGVLSQLDVDGISGINYIKPSYAELNANKKKGE